MQRKREAIACPTTSKLRSKPPLARYKIFKPSKQATKQTRTHAHLRQCPLPFTYSFSNNHRFDISFPGRELFKDANLLLAHGRKYGLVAPNGTGKSTLLQYIAGTSISRTHSNILYLLIDGFVLSC